MRKAPKAVGDFLTPELRMGVEDSLQLLEHVRSLDSEKDLPVSDYSFVVFPMAKAYEGFLKLYFRRHNLLNEKHFQSRHFRIGRSFNPDLPRKFKDDVWLFDDVANLCGPDLARRMWEVWVDGRNHLFHFFPDGKYQLTLSEAEVLVNRFLKLMEEALTCK